MIVAIFLLYNYGSSLMRYIGFNKFFLKNECAVLIFDVPTIDCKTFYCNSNLKFEPPLYFQRYEVVRRILKTKNKLSAGNFLKVIDFGCSEISFFSFVKHMKGVHEYIAVDIDRTLLDRCCCKIQPLTFDYLRKRAEPFAVQILCGSVAEPDYRLQNSNAVVAIELIEHLYPDILEELPYNIFGLIQPEIAIFTTPNSEFNYFFPNFTGFRHDDHKFEWTREQFQSWANNLVLRYPNYKVLFGGVGQAPDNREDLGFCTQIAVFFRKNVKFDTSSQFYDVYEEIKKVDYPFKTEEEKVEEIIQYEAGKFIDHCSSLDCYQTDDDTEIPLKNIHNFVLKKCSCTEIQLRNLLILCGWNVNTLKDGTEIVTLSPYGEKDDDSYVSASTQEDYVQYQTSKVSLIQEEEDWDDPTFVATMEPTYNGVKKSEVDDNPSAGEITQRESLSSIDISNPDTISVVSFVQPLYEEAHTSCSGENNSVVQPYLKENSCSSSSCVKNEISSDKAVTFVRNPLQKCHSLESFSKDQCIKSNPCRFSLNIDKYKCFNCDNVCSENNDLQKVSSVLSVSDNYAPRQEDSCSQSKAADSGYPNSYEQDMDLDLTPEQVDEIITESESSFDGEVDDESGGDEDEHLEIRGEIVRLGENVENGDVANNNRDGEGNNMEAVAAGGILQFEQVIEEEEVAVGNLAAADLPPDVEENMAFVSAEVEEIIESRSVQQPILFNPENNVRFPDWLINILAEDLDLIEDGVGAGDAHILQDHRQNRIENENSEEDAVSLFSEPDLNSVMDIFDEPPVELIVQGDLLGGGEPPPM